MRPRNEHKRSPCCMVRRGRECARSSKVRQKRAFLLFPERMEKQRRVEKYAFELVFCDCLFCEFPEKSGVKLIGKLMDYYLPTTVRLLSAYDDLEDQPIQGETISQSRLEIERTLDVLISAYEKLLDATFQDLSLDVSADIDVLHAMLAQEGLTPSPFDMKTQK